MDEEESREFSEHENRFEINDLLNKIITALKNDTEKVAEQIIRDILKEKIYLGE